MTVLSGLHTNHASADSTETSPVNSSATYATAEITLGKTVYTGHNLGASCPGTDLVSGLSGANVTYCFVVDNTGGTVLSITALDDPALGTVLGDLTYLSGDTDTDGLLDTTETWTYYYESTINTDLTNTSTVTANPVDGTGADIPNLADVTDNDSAAVDLLHAPVLQVVKSGPTSAVVGATVTYMITVAHDAVSDGSPVSGLTVNDNVAGAATYDSGDDGDNLLEFGRDLDVRGELHDPGHGFRSSEQHGDGDWY